VVAWLVRESGMVGMTFDSEIGPAGGFWNYANQMHNGSFEK